MENRKKWRFVHTGVADAAYNMAVDEALLLSVSSGCSLPVLRFYRWQPAAMSIGCFQKSNAEINIRALQDCGYDFVRRPTGGRAVFHDCELTYSIIVSEADEQIPRTVNEAYRVLSEGLLLGFQNIGLAAEMVRLNEKGKKQDEESMRTAACFDAPSWYELVVEGRKIAGSAQTRQKGVLLQHGSILLELDINRYVQMLQVSERVSAERLTKKLSDHAVAINDLRRQKGMSSMQIDDLERPFLEGISEALHIEWVVDQLTENERLIATQLVQNKYASADWNFRT
jgi:lipoate-protein ligase A